MTWWQSFEEFDIRNPPPQFAEKLKELYGHRRMEKFFSQYKKPLKTIKDLTEGVKNCFKSSFFEKKIEWNQIPGKKEGCKELLVILCNKERFPERIIDGLELTIKCQKTKEEVKEIVILPTSWSNESEYRLRVIIPQFFQVGVTAIFIKFPITSIMRGFVQTKTRQRPFNF